MSERPKMKWLGGVDSVLRHFIRSHSAAIGLSAEASRREEKISNPLRDMQA